MELLIPYLTRATQPKGLLGSRCQQEVGQQLRGSRPATLWTFGNERIVGRRCTKLQRSVEYLVASARIKQA